MFKKLPAFSANMLLSDEQPYNMNQSGRVNIACSVKASVIYEQSRLTCSCLLSTGIQTINGVECGKQLQSMQNPMNAELHVTCKQAYSRNLSCSCFGRCCTATRLRSSVGGAWHAMAIQKNIKEAGKQAYLRSPSCSCFCGAAQQ